MRAGLAACAFLVAFGLSAPSAYPTIAPLDSAELAAVGATLGIAHSPGYPLFSLAGKAWTSLMPLGNAAYRMNLFSVFCSALAVAALVWLGAAQGAAAGIAAGIVLLAAPAFSKEAAAAEVFGLNTLWAAALAVCMSALSEKPSRRLLCFAAFLGGLGLGNQHTLILVAPALALAWSTGNAEKLRGGAAPGSRKRSAGAPGPHLSEERAPADAGDAALGAERSGDGRGLALDLGLAAGFFALGLTVYAFVYLRSLRAPAMDWEEPRTWERFWGLLSRARYGTLSLAQGGQATPWSFERIASSLKLFASLNWENLRLTGSAAAAAGLAALALRRPRFAAATLAAWVISGPCFFVLTKMGPGENSRLIMERFLPLTLVFASVWAGAAIAEIKSPRWAGALALLIAFPWSPVRARDLFAAHDLIRDHFRTLPPGAVFIADRADEAEFGTAFLHLAEGRRADLRFVDGNAGVTPSIYGPDYYGIWGPPRLAVRERVEGGLIAASSVPVYYATLEPDQLKVSREREGMLWRAKGPPRRLDWSELYALRWDSELPRRERYLVWSQHHLLAPYALDRGDLSGAERHYRGAAALSGDPAAAHALAGAEYLGRGRVSDAVRHMEAALAQRPDPRTWSNLGVARERLGDVKGAVAAHRRALELDAAFVQGYRNLGAACWRLEDWSCAARAFETVLRLEPGDASALRYAAAARARMR